MQGGLWNQYTDPLEGENLMKFMNEIYKQNKDKIRHGQNTIQKQYKMHNFTLSYVQYASIWSMQFMHRFVG